MDKINNKFRKKNYKLATMITSDMKPTDNQKLHASYTMKQTIYNYVQNRAYIIKTIKYVQKNYLIEKKT